MTPSHPMSGPNPNDSATQPRHQRGNRVMPALVEQLGAEIAAQLDTLAGEPIAARFLAVLRTQLAVVERRDELGVFFGGVMQSAAECSVGSAALEEAFGRLVSEASDAPPVAQAEALAALLQSLYFALVWFWLVDRTPDQRATRELLAFVHDMLGLLRKMLPLPLVRQAVARLAAIMMSVFGSTEDSEPA